jgi:diguanylate cyclase (GGDEF)-like protein
MIRVVICDSSPESRAALKDALAERPDFEIVGETDDGEMSVALAASLTPDAVLLAPRMVGLSREAACKRIRGLLPETYVAALPEAADPHAVAWEIERAVGEERDPLLSLARALSRAATGGGVAELVAGKIAELTGAAAAVYLAAPDVGISLAAAAGPFETARLVVAPGVAVRAFREGRLASADGRELAGLSATGIPTENALAVPLIHDGETLGAVFAAMPDALRLRVDPDLVSAIADLAASAAATQRSVALTYAEARRDALTGLPNRRAFDERLAECAGEFAVALIDVDDFKEVNDRHGHAAGDDVLRQIARIAQRAVRANDDVYRLGGDELAVVVTGGSSASVTVLVDRIRTEVARYRRGAVLPTVSAGVAAFPADAASTEQLLERADAALYAAKRAGKGRVAVYSASHFAGAGGPAPAEEWRGGGSAEGTPAPRPDHRRGDGAVAGRAGGLRPRILVVDDDALLRDLLHTTLAYLDADVEEAATAAAAAEKIAAWQPDAVVLDIGLPDTDGLTLCRRLKDDPATAGPSIIVLTGADLGVEAQTAGADAFLRKPFSPLELLSVVERFAGGTVAAPVRAAEPGRRDDQLQLYAEDLRRLLELELGQRELLQRAYRETVGALAAALESKDVGTGAHSQRVQRYAVALAGTLSPALLDDPGVEYGFLLHDVGKIGIPDSILTKPGPLTPVEWRLLRNHTVLGEQLLGQVGLLQGEGLRIVRSHHERWDGNGYPDGLAATDIPLGARIFAVADTLDAMTTDRPYRPAGCWQAAAREVASESGRQFDPDVVAAFDACEEHLLEIRDELVRGVTHG